jgi:D-alanyl-lipoteichoic acid acyltransferase DltB (MBOAT superfamily)
MDITIEGFHSWMWRGLSFLLPFLYVGYVYQLYNAYTLYKLIFHPEATWQVYLKLCVCHLLYINRFCLIKNVIEGNFRDI